MSMQGVFIKSYFLRFLRESTEYRGRPLDYWLATDNENSILLQITTASNP